MKQSVSKFLSGLGVLAMVLAACGPATQPAPTQAPQPTQAAAPTKAADPTKAPAPTTAVAAKGKVCEVTDTGGVNDKSFNQTAWAGAQESAKQVGWEPSYLESQQQTDYEKNITEFINSKCDLVVTVGFLLGDATLAAAQKNPTQKFQILDFAYAEKLDNVWQQLYATDQGAFLAGYVAAGTSKTGKVGTFGGIQIPPVEDFMDGFVLGVAYYNEKNGTKVEVLGWDATSRKGLFAGNFNSTDDGKRLGESLMDEGVDVILPVAGPVGLGTAAAIKERGNAWLIGVDTDWTISAAEYKSIILTSIEKRLDLSVIAAVKAAAEGKFAGGVHVATLATGEIGLSPFHDAESAIPAAVKEHLPTLIADITAGKIPTKPGAQPAVSGTPVKVCEVTDTGGVNDKSFNQTAWAGAQEAAKVTGGEASYLESQQQTDYEKNITEFINSKCDVIVTVGFLLGDATLAAAQKNTTQKFQILDFAYDPALPNVWAQVYATDQGAFLAGYVAAGMSKTGKVGTFGGIQIPPVEDFMDGFVLGVAYYNEKHSTKVEVLGWDAKTRKGLFAGNFNSTDDGKRLGESLMDEGVDVILPVAGPVGLGTAAAIKERGNAMLIGVDTDWTVSAAEYKSIILTSIEKRLDLSVVSAIKAASEGKFKGGTVVATLATGEIGISPFHDFDSQVSAELKAEIEQVRQDIIDGKIQTRPTK